MTASIAPRTVSLVKVYFTAGWNMPGYLPESDPTIFTNLDDARAYLADELDRAADELFQLEFDNALQDAHETGEWATVEDAHGDSASMNATAEIVRNDRDGDVTWSAMRGGWSTIEPDGYAYYIERI